MLVNWFRAAAVTAILAGGIPPAVTPAAAQHAFIPRPTQPYDCRSMAGAPVVWAGFFWGRKEVDWGFIRYQDAREHVCFDSEQDCRNWLYNMLSEYRGLVWRSECVPGLG